MVDVSVWKCDSYDADEVRAALVGALDAISGLDFVKEGMRIVIKANLVSFMSPDAAATTHPTMLCELVRLLRERGAEVVVGDSPGGLYNAAFAGRACPAAS